jgi:hypothetical protein
MIRLVLFVLFCNWPLAAFAQLQILPDAQPQRVFAGGARTVTATWHNAGDRTVEADIRTRIVQTSSATGIPLGDIPWKKLEMLPRQTVLENVQFEFPAVKAETTFLIQWLDATNHVLGRTKVLAYPTNLLAELKPLAGDESLGVFDPKNRLKPLLKNLKLEFADLANLDLEDFSGRLAIIGPFSTRAQMRDELANQIKALAKKGVAIVWLQPLPEKQDKLQPSFYSVSMNTNAVVVVQPELVADLADNPQSQLNLIYFCRLALHPHPPTLPDLTTRP